MNEDLFENFEESVNKFYLNENYEKIFEIVSKELTKYTMSPQDWNEIPFLIELEAYITQIQGKLEKEPKQNQNLANCLQTLAEVKHTRYHLSNYQIFLQNLSLDNEIIKNNTIDSLLNDIALILGKKKDFNPILHTYIEILNKSLQIHKEGGNIDKEIEILSALEHIHIHLWEFDKSLDYNHELLSKYQKRQDKKQISKTLLNLGILYWSISTYQSQNNEENISFETSLKYFEQGLSVCEQTGDMVLLGRIYLFMGAIQWYSYGNAKLGSEMMTKAKKIHLESGGVQEEAFDIYMLSHYHHENYDLELASKYITEAFSIIDAIEEKTPFLNVTLALYTGIQGYFEITKGAMDKAFLLVQEANKRLLESNHMPHEHFAIIWCALARLYFYNKDYISTFYWIKQASMYSKLINLNRYNLNLIYINLINFTLALHKEDYSVQFLNLMHINTSKKDKTKQAVYMQDQYLLAKAKYLENEIRMKDKAQAQEIVEQLLTNSNFVERKYQWCEVLFLKLKLDLFEFQSTGAEILLPEIKNSINKLQEIAHSLKIWNLYVETSLLSIELEIINGNYQKGIELLEKIAKIGNEKQIFTVKNKLKELREAIDQKIKKSQRLLEKNISLVERVRLSEMNDFVEEAKRWINLQNLK